MFRLVHISDIHIGESAKTDANAVALVNYIIENFPADTVVVITGDLVHYGTPGGYETLRETVLTPLRQKFTVLTCPGNHDYCTNWLGSRLSEESVERYRETTGDGPFPHVHVVEGEGTALIGMDSSDPNDKAWLAGGLIEGWQVDRLKGILAEHADKLRIVYFHHHPFAFRLAMFMWGSSALLRAMALHGVRAAIFGHRHWSQMFRDTRGVPLMLSSRKSTKPRWFSGGKLSFRVLEIEDGSVTRVYAEEFKP